MALKLKLPIRGKHVTKAELEPVVIARPRPDLAAQFRGADWRNPATLPPAPKFLLCFLIAAFAAFAVWLLLIRGQMEELESRRQEEEKLKQEFITKATKVANLEPLLKQRQQAEEYVAQLERQLPGKSEMDALLSDINQAGVGRNLQFELFKPGNEEVKDYYAQLPVAIRVSGSFPEIATFASDIARLSRIVTLSNVNITHGKDGEKGSGLFMEATANTYRYLDKSEKLANASKNAKDNKKPASKKPEGAKP